MGWSLRMVAVIALATTSIVGQGFEFTGKLVPSGQWAGPWEFTQMEPFHEIAHAALLPPPVNGTDGSGQPLDTHTRLESVRVFFYCSAACAEVEPPQPEIPFPTSFLWNLDEPGRVTAQPITFEPKGWAADLFCGGHVQLANGDLLVSGGTNWPAT